VIVMDHDNRKSREQLFAEADRVNAETDALLERLAERSAEAARVKAAAAEAASAEVDELRMIAERQRAVIKQYQQPKRKRRIGEPLFSDEEIERCSDTTASLGGVLRFINDICAAVDRVAADLNKLFGEIADRTKVLEVKIAEMEDAGKTRSGEVINLPNWRAKKGELLDEAEIKDAIVELFDEGLDDAVASR
jgi:hypothetical protein